MHQAYFFVCCGCLKKKKKGKMYPNLFTGERERAPHPMKQQFCCCISQLHNSFVVGPRSPAFLAPWPFFIDTSAKLAQAVRPSCGRVQASI